MKKILYPFLVLFVIIVVAFILLKNKSHESVPLIQEDNAIILVDQKPDIQNDTITVGYAKLSKPGYVVVSSVGSGNKQTIIGTSDLLSTGEHFNVKIKRKHRSSGKVEKITAALVADNGDGIFDPTEDMPLSVNEGEDIVAADESVIDDSIAEDGEVSLEELVELLDEDGYTINEEADISDTEVGSEETQNESFENSIDDTDSSDDSESIQGE